MPNSLPKVSAGICVLLSVALSACGGISVSQGHAASPASAPAAHTGKAPLAKSATDNAPPVAARTIAPPAAGRLAIATDMGMEVWSARTGTFTVGPTRSGAVVSNVAWSTDGRYLSWQTIYPHRGAQLWVADVVTGQVRNWGPLPKGHTYGPVVVTGGGVLTLGRTIEEFRAGSSTAPAPRAKPRIAFTTATNALSWSSGWVVVPPQRAGFTATRIDTSGAVLAPTLQVSTPLPLGHVTVDRSGRRIAAEAGDQGDSCSTGSAAELWLITLRTNMSMHSTPPLLQPGAAQLIWSVDLSPSGVAYVATYDCQAAKVAHGATLTSTLWRYADGNWDHVGAGLLTADASPTGTIATLAGSVTYRPGQPPVATGSGAVTVDGKVVATGADAINWAP